MDAEDRFAALERLITKPGAINFATVAILYRRARADFAIATERACAISRGAGGRSTPSDRHFFGSVIFTRISVTASTVLKLAPCTAGPIPERRALWDASSCASLVRNLIESYLVFFELAVDAVKDEDEWLTRLNFLQLRDNRDRYKMLRDLGSQDDGLYETHRAGLVERLKGRAFFRALAEKKQAVLLRGDGDLFTRDELLDRMGGSRIPFQGMYRFLECSHAHWTDSVLSYGGARSRNRGRERR